jgi:hypothetical protein
MQRRILLIGTDPVDSIIQAISNRGLRLSVVVVTTPAALMAALSEGSYTAIMLQYGLPWTTNPSVTQLLAQWLPTCPLVIFKPQDSCHMPFLLNHPAIINDTIPTA